MRSAGGGLPTSPRSRLAVEKLDIALEEELATDLGQLLEQHPELCDVVFHVGSGGEAMPALGLLVAARSAVLRREVEAARAGSAAAAAGGKTVVRLPAQNPHIFRLVLQFVHTGRLRGVEADLLALLDAAHTYGLGGLKVACQDLLSNRIEPGNVLELLARTGTSAGQAALRRRCLRYWEDHTRDVLATGALASPAVPVGLVCLLLSRPRLSNISELELYRAAAAWVRAQAAGASTSAAAVAQRPMACIRFPLIPIAELMGECRADGLVSLDTLLEAVAFQGDPKSVPSQGERFRPRNGKELSWQWDAERRHPDLVLSDGGTRVMVPTDIRATGYRNVLGTPGISAAAGSVTWAVHVGGLHGAQWVCLGVATSASLPSDVYNGPELCTFSSSSHTFGVVLAGTALSIGNGDTIILSANMTKRQLVARKSTASKWTVKMVRRAGEGGGVERGVVQFD